MEGRSPYLVTKALNSYLRGSIIIAISGQLATTTDAVIVSHLIGRNALTAVNIVIPILTLFSTIMILLGAGAAITIAKNMGLRESEKVNLSFSSSISVALILGIVIGVITYFFTPYIIEYLVNGDIAVENYARQYLQTFCYAAPFLITAGVMERIIRTDGNTKLVRIAVWVGIILNVVLDIVLVGYTKLGIAGAAWATGINYLVTLLICLLHFASRNNTIKWSNRYKDYIRQISTNCRLGFSTSLSTFLMGVSLFVINGIVIKLQGSEGIYCWAVCYQIFLILQMLLSCVDTSIFAIGGVLYGEDDMPGLYYLYRRCLVYIILTVVVLSAIIILFPEFFGSIFGNKGEDKLDLLPEVIKIFSLFLLPFALVAQVRSIYTIIERGRLSLFLCIVSYGLIMLFSYWFPEINRGIFWWSFPSSSWILFIFLLIYTLIIHYRDKNIRVYSLIPKKEPCPSLNVSVALDLNDIKNTDSQIDNFLRKEGIDSKKASSITEYCEEAMENIFEKLSNEKIKQRFFDVHLRIREKDIILIIKDDGPRLTTKEESQIMSSILTEDPTLGAGDSNQKNDCTPGAYYFYLNDQNTYTLKFC